MLNGLVDGFHDDAFLKIVEAIQATFRRLFHGRDEKRLQFRVLGLNVPRNRIVVKGAIGTESSADKCCGDCATKPGGGTGPGDPQREQSCANQGRDTKYEGEHPALDQLVFPDGDGEQVGFQYVGIHAVLSAVCAFPVGRPLRPAIPVSSSKAAQSPTINHRQSFC